MANQLAAVTGRGVQRRFAPEIASRARYLPQIYAEKGEQERFDKTMDQRQKEFEAGQDLAEEALESQEQQSDRAAKLAAAGLGVSAATLVPEISNWLAESKQTKATGGLSGGDIDAIESGNQGGTTGDPWYQGFVDQNWLATGLGGATGGLAGGSIAQAVAGDDDDWWKYIGGAAGGGLGGYIASGGDIYGGITGAVIGAGVSAFL